MPIAKQIEKIYDSLGQWGLLWRVPQGTCKPYLYYNIIRTLGGMPLQ